MKKIIAIGGSNSSKSINKIFASHIANRIENAEVTTMNWTDFELPLYSPDLEAKTGVHENAIKFKDLLESSDAVVLSMAEHNGFQSAAFKNLWDWTSRLDAKFWADKPMFLAAASPGGQGGTNVLRVTKELIPHFGGNVVTDFSLPTFYENFKEGKITNEDLEEDLTAKIELFNQAI